MPQDQSSCVSVSARPPGSVHRSWGMRSAFTSCTLFEPQAPTRLARLQQCPPGAFRDSDSAACSHLQQSQACCFVIQSRGNMLCSMSGWGTCVIGTRQLCASTGVRVQSECWCRLGSCMRLQMKCNNPRAHGSYHPKRQHRRWMCLQSPAPDCLLAHAKPRAPGVRLLAGPAADFILFVIERFAHATSRAPNVAPCRIC